MTQRQHNPKDITVFSDTKGSEYIPKRQTWEHVMEMNPVPIPTNTSKVEIELSKPTHDLYVGQILKSVVVASLNQNEVTIQINGQNINAKTAHHFNPGDLLDVKVMANQDELVLEVLAKTSNASVLQNALLLALPKQAPATQLLNHLQQLLQSNPSLPYAIQQQIKALLNSLTPLESLPQQILRGIHLSGLFFENKLADGKSRSATDSIRCDIKAQCFQLLGSLSKVGSQASATQSNTGFTTLQKDSLPLPGAIPQPLTNQNKLALLDLDLATMEQVIKEEVIQVLARITAHQVNHLKHTPQNGFYLTLDLPIITPQGVEVIPLMIEHHKAQSTEPSKWCLSFATHLSQLGSIQGVLSVSTNTIDIKLNTDHPQTLSLLEKNQEEMAAALTHCGLKLRHLKIQLGLENNLIQAQNLRLLDIKI